MITRFDEYVSGGYFASVYGDGVSRNAWLRSVCHAPDDLLPERFLSVAACGVPKAPTFVWAVDEDYEAFGIPIDRRSELELWTEAHMGFPDVFFDLSAVREYITKFSGTPDGVQILGISLHNKRLNLLAELERLRPPHIADNGSHVAGFKDNGFARSLHMNQAPVLAEVLGFDLICC